jgi:hypothetical protein
MSTSNFPKAMTLAPPSLVALALGWLAFARGAPATATETASAGAAATVSATASAAAVSAAEARPGPAPAALGDDAPSLAEWSPPEAASDKPKPEEWDRAPPLALLRPHAQCTASAIREWVRISCKDPNDDFKGVRVVAGSEKDVSIADFQWKGIGKDWETGKDKERMLDGVAVIFPVRKGDRRVMTVIRWISGGWKSWYIREDTVTTISELWLPGEPRPAIVLH